MAREAANRRKRETFLRDLHRSPMTGLKPARRAFPTGSIHSGVTDPHQERKVSPRDPDRQARSIGRCHRRAHQVVVGPGAEDSVGRI